MVTMRRPTPDHPDSFVLGFRIYFLKLDFSLPARVPQQRAARLGVLLKQASNSAKQTNKQASKQTSKQASKQASKQSKQASQPASKQASKQASKRASNQARSEQASKQAASKQASKQQAASKEQSELPRAAKSSPVLRKIWTQPRKILKQFSHSKLRRDKNKQSPQKHLLRIAFGQPRPEKIRFWAPDKKWKNTIERKWKNKWKKMKENERKWKKMKENESKWK